MRIARNGLEEWLQKWSCRSKTRHPQSQILPCSIGKFSSGSSPHCCQAHYILNMDGEIDDDTSSWGSAPPDPDHDSDDDVASWPSIYSYHGSWYPH